MELLLNTYRSDAVNNFAAESYVDRSICNPGTFVRTNVLGTSILLHVTKAWWDGLAPVRKAVFRFLHVPTDEAFGMLQPGDPAFTESTPYSPNSPYSALKASSYHFVHAFHENYCFSTLITNCSNNYGPRQFPEKLILLVTLMRWPAGLCRYMEQVLISATGCMSGISAPPSNGCSNSAGETYNIGGNSERTNLEIVKGVCAILETSGPQGRGLCRSHEVCDGLSHHDFRYTINNTKLTRSSAGSNARL